MPDGRGSVPGEQLQSGHPEAALFSVYKHMTVLLLEKFQFSSFLC